MAYLSPSMKHNLAVVIAVLSGIILLMGTIPFLNIGTNYSIMGIFTLGQLLGALNLFIAWMLYKKELR